MALTAKQIDAAKPKDKPYKIRDIEGLYLYISISLSPDQNHGSVIVMLMAGARRSRMGNIPIFLLLMPA